MQHKCLCGTERGTENADICQRNRDRGACWELLPKPLLTVCFAGGGAIRGRALKRLLHTNGHRLLLRVETGELLPSHFSPCVCVFFHTCIAWNENSWRVFVVEFKRNECSVCRRSGRSVVLVLSCVFYGIRGTVAKTERTSRSPRRCPTL